MPGMTVAVLTNAGGAHLDAYFAGLAATPEAEGVVVVDPSGVSEDLAKKTLGEKLRSFEREYDKALTRHKPAMAVVTLEAVQSPPVIKAALDANCHVLAEKPSCIRGEDFVSLAQLADTKHRQIMLALANRLRGTAQTARKMLRAGAFGQLYGCEMHIIADQTRLTKPAYHKSWFADSARAGGGQLVWLGIHWIDLVMFLTGARITETTGFIGIVGGQPIKAEDSAAMAVRFDNGMFGTITGGYYLDKGYQSHVKIWGSHGWLQLEPHGKTPFQWYSTKDPNPAVKTYEGPADAASYTPFVQSCVRSCLNLEAPPITTAESLLAVQTVFSCYRSAATGRVEKVS